MRQRVKGTYSMVMELQGQAPSYTRLKFGVRWSLTSFPIFLMVKSMGLPKKTEKYLNVSLKFIPRGLRA